ncbi:MAG: hypothetical protein WBK96_14960 [Candidatus Manganitrophaceae bacterium]
MSEREQPDVTSFSYDAFCDFLGGAGSDQADRSGPSDQAPSSLSAAPAFLFSNDPTRLPLEVCWLKWNLFLALCRRVRKRYFEDQRPLLSIEPARIRVTLLPPPEPFFPARWLFSVDAAGVETAVPFIPPGMPSNFAGRIFLPPGEPHPIYAAPPLHQNRLRREGEGTVLIQKMERIRESEERGVRGLLQVHLVSDALRDEESVPADVFLVTIHSHHSYPGEGEEAGFRLWASKKGRSERGLLLEGMTDPLSLSDWEGIEKVRQKVFSSSRFTLYKSCHLPCDLYSLGMTLLRALLVNDRHEMSEIDRMIRRTIPEVREKVEWQIRALLKKGGDLFSSRSVLYHEKDRLVEGGGIPEGVWGDLLLFAFRLIIWAPGFGYCRDRGEFESDHPDSLLDQVIAEGEDLAARIALELFGSRRRNREILEVCDLIRMGLDGVRDHAV